MEAIRWEYKIINIRSENYRSDPAKKANSTCSGTRGGNWWPSLRSTTRRRLPITSAWSSNGAKTEPAHAVPSTTSEAEAACRRAPLLPMTPDRPRVTTPISAAERTQPRS